MRRSWIRVAAVATGAALSGAAPAADEVPAAAIAAFERYVDAAEARMQRDRAGGRLLWIDGLPADRRLTIERRLSRGAVVSQPLHAESGGMPLAARDAVFLHAVAAVFLRGATVDATVQLLQDYDRHAEIFAPTIRRSRIVQRRGHTLVVAGQFAHKKIFTIVYNAEVEAGCESLTERQAECRSVATRGAMVADAGRPTEREKPFRGDPRKQWFLRTYYRIEERNGGSYVEHETLFVCPPLSPFARFFTPLVRDVPAEISEKLLAELRRQLSRS
jgi:hypothetical protein